MSSSVGYYVSPADIEAQRRRALRADIAATLARLAEMRAHGRSIGLTVPAVAGEHRTDRITDIDELEELRAQVSSAVADAAEAIDAGWSRRWHATIGKATLGTKSAGSGVTAAQELVRSRAPAPQEPMRDQLNDALNDAESLLAGNGHR